MSGWLRGTRARLTLVYAVLFLVVAGAAAAGLWISFYSYEYGTVDAGLRAQAGVVRALLEQSTPASGQLILPKAVRGLPIQSFVVDPTGGRVLAQSPEDADAGAVPALRPRGSFPALAEISTHQVRGQLLRVLERATSYRGVPAGLILTRAVDDVRDGLARAALLLLPGVLGLAAVASGLAHWLSGRALTPVREMSAAAREITDKDLARRLRTQLPPGDELGELADTFDSMLDRLESAFTSLRHFTAEAAHELRAPLALMRTQVEVTLRAPRSAEQYRESHRHLLQEIARLSRITDQLLMLARSDAGTLGPHYESFDLPDLLEEVADRWRRGAPAGSLLESAIPPEGGITADHDLLCQLLDNLLDNAFRHAPAAGQVRLSARREGRSWLLQVSDDGPGIPAELRPRLFDRFSRGDFARGRATGGAGLGLSLCAAIAALHGGSVELVPSPLGGACFLVSLPAGLGVRRPDAGPGRPGRPPAGARSPGGSPRWR